jgi:hypothetical protein
MLEDPKSRTRRRRGGNTNRQQSHGSNEQNSPARRDFKKSTVGPEWTVDGRRSPGNRNRSNCGTEKAIRTIVFQETDSGGNSKTKHRESSLLEDD